MIPRKSIGIDLDSTLNELDHAWCAWIRESLDPEFTLDKWLSWNNHTPAGKAIYAFLDIPGVFEAMDVREDAVAVTERLANHHELFVISASVNPNCIPEKHRWLTRHFPHIPATNYVFTDAKHLFGVDLLIDDGAHNVRGHEGKFLLLDQPWNRDNDLARARGWKEVESYLEARKLL
jgi:5'(3')-deoxyribonucleotidase